MEVLIIDTSIVLYKIQHSIGKVVKKDGVSYDVSFLVGLPQIIKNSGYDRIYFALDGFPKYHYDIYPPYKGDRNYEFNGTLSVPMSTQLSYIYSMAKIYGIDVRFLCTPFNEADQVIYSFVESYHTPFLRNFHTHVPMCDDKYLEDFKPTSVNNVVHDRKVDKFTVLTTDSDIYQVQCLGNVHVSNDIRGMNTHTGATPVAVFKVNPATIALFKSLFGDASDNVPHTVTRSDANKRIIADLFDDAQAVDEFIHSLQTKNHQIRKELIPIYNDLKKPGALRQFFINYKLTKLTFTSLPYEVTPCELDVFELRAKYGMR